MIQIDRLNQTTAKLLNKLILDGKIILWPSGGVYGLACNALDITAIHNLYQLKNRDYSKPFSLITSANTVFDLAYPTKLDKKIIFNRWPDFIGIIAPKKKIIPEIVSSGLDTIGLVCSSGYNEFLAENIDVPLASTSANLSGQPEIIDAETAIKKFGDKVAAIILTEKNENCLNTIISTYNVLKIVRQGKYSEDEIKKILDNI